MIPEPHKFTILGTPKRLYRSYFDKSIIPKKLDEEIDAVMDSWIVGVEPQFYSDGLQYGYPICCVIFYWNCWMFGIREKIPEYTERHVINGSHIPCPECLIKLMYEHGYNERKSSQSFPSNDYSGWLCWHLIHSQTRDGELVE